MTGSKARQCRHKQKQSWHGWRQCWHKGRQTCSSEALTTLAMSSLSCACCGPMRTRSVPDTA
eukprot:3941821-Rhodomonas_salina.2